MNLTTMGAVRGLRRFAAMALLILLLVTQDEGISQAVPSLDATTASGGVHLFTVGIGGKVDGAVLNDGTTIHWNPNFSDKILEIVAVGDRIQVTGRRRMTPRKESVFEATQITNLLIGKSLKLTPLPPPVPVTEKVRPPRP